MTKIKTKRKINAVFCKDNKERLEQIIKAKGDTNELAKAISETIDEMSDFKKASKEIMEFFDKNLHINIVGEQLVDLLTRHRSEFKPGQVCFPPPGILSHHRRPFRKSRWHPLGIIERWKRISGILPKSLEKYYHVS